VTAGEVQQSASDDAKFLCQTPGLTVAKDCALQDANGKSAVTITVTNSGTADLENCTVTDANFTDAGCPASGPPTGASSAVAVTPSTIASLPAGSAAVTATGTVTGLTKNSCNTTSVTCDIKGSVDPNNPGHEKKLSATAQDTCETCSVQVDKQISCGNASCTNDADCMTQTGDANAKCLSTNAGQRCFVDVGFESTSAGGLR